MKKSHLITQVGFFLLTQIHSSKCAGFVFARHGDPMQAENKYSYFPFEKSRRTMSTKSS